MGDSNESTINLMRTRFRYTSVSFYDGFCPSNFSNSNYGWTAQTRSVKKNYTKSYPNLSNT